MLEPFVPVQDAFQVCAVDPDPFVVP